MNARTQANNPEFMSSWLVHFENTKIVRTFWLQVTNSWNSWFFSLFASWFVVASKPNTPFSGNIVSSWLRALMQQTFFLNIMCSWVHMLHTQPPDFWHGLVTSCVMNASRLIFSTSSWLREFVCCKHNHLIFCTGSWLREFVCCQHKPPDFQHEFVSSCGANITACILARVREASWVRVLSTQTAWFSVWVRDCARSRVVNTSRLLFQNEFVPSRGLELADNDHDLQQLKISHWQNQLKSLVCCCYFF